jgi:hypothetical protein
MNKKRRAQVALPSGTPVNGYLIESLLGVGNFGVTYKARDVLLNMPVAIKEYFPASVAERVAGGAVRCGVTHKQEAFEGGKQRFVIEAKIAAKFNHPNIVNILRYFYENNTAYLVMRFEPGNELGSLIQKGRTPAMTAPVLLPIVRSVLVGLKVLHEAGCVHRDVKPSNIFIRDAGEPMLLDFGGAQAEDVTGAKEVKVVTPYYAPIEQYDREVDSFSPSLDIYALGATIYRCIKGKPPTRSTVRQLGVDADKKDPYDPIARLQPEGYPLAVLELIDGMLELRAANRPQSAAELLRQFDAAIADNSSVIAGSGPVMQELVTIICGDKTIEAQFMESLATIAEVAPLTFLRGQGDPTGVNEGHPLGKDAMVPDFQVSYPNGISSSWRADIFVTLVTDLQPLLKGAILGGAVIWLIDSAEAGLEATLSDFHRHFSDLATVGLNILIGLVSGAPGAEVEASRRLLTRSTEYTHAANSIAVMSLEPDRPAQVGVFIDSLLALREAKIARQ